MEQLDMQKLAYFTEGNIFTGSRTKDWKKKIVLRYLVKPDLKEEKLLAYCWNEDLCFERAQNKDEAEFQLSEAGIEGIQSWLQEKHGAL